MTYTLYLLLNSCTTPYITTGFSEPFRSADFFLEGVNVPGSKNDMSEEYWGHWYREVVP